jgi:alkylresorcinol/alkylpyrone synthase
MVPSAARRRARWAATPSTRLATVSVTKEQQSASGSRLSIRSRLMLAEYPLPSIRAIGTALPPHYADQETLTAALRELWLRKHSNTRRFDQIQASLQVSGRYLPMPMAEYIALDTFAKCNDAWMRLAPELGVAAAHDALERAGLVPRDIDHLFFVTVTGIATPSIDTRVVNGLGMRSDIKRTPIFGLGCAAGAAGAARAADYVRGYPGEVAMLLSVELCSLTLQREDLSVANMIASGLFGDGAAAMILGGGARADAAGPRVIATRSILYRDTEPMLGWEIVDSGFKIVLSPRVPEILEQHLRADVDSFLAQQRLTRSHVSHWIGHAGGPKILAALEHALEIPRERLERSWRSLAQVGNLSSASVLFILSDLLADGAAQAGDYGVIIGIGPGLTIELVLMQW